MMSDEKFEVSFSLLFSHFLSSEEHILIGDSNPLIIAVRAKIKAGENPHKRLKEGGSLSLADV